jgi:hypothetical protein
MPRVPTPKFLIPKLVNGRGTIPIDVSFKGVGRIRVSSGTTDEQTYVDIRQMLDELYNHANIATLKAIQSKSVKPLLVLAQTKNRGIKTSITEDLSRPILTALAEWLETTPSLKDATKKSYRGQIDSFAQVVTASDTMEVLVDRLKSYRKLKQRQQFHDTFNKTRAALMSFVKAEFGKTSQLYFELSAVENLKRLRNKNNQFGLEVSDVVALTEGAPKDISAMVWSMASTGLRSYEYLQDEGVTWKAEKVKDPIANVSTESVYVDKPNPGHGNKGQSRWTLNPFPSELVKPSVAYRQFNRYLKKLQPVIGRKVSLTTFRHSFVHWCQLAGIPNERIEVYLGHKHKGTIGIYMGYKEHAYMSEDNAKLRSYIQATRTVNVNPNWTKFFEHG